MREGAPSTKKLYWVKIWLTRLMADGENLASRLSLQTKGLSAGPAREVHEASRLTGQRHASTCLWHSQSPTRRPCIQTINKQQARHSQPEYAPELAVPPLTVPHDVLHLRLAPLCRFLQLLSDKQARPVLKLAVNLLSTTQILRPRFVILASELRTPAYDRLDVAEHG